MHLDGIQPTDISKVWDEVAPLLAPAVARTEFTLESVREQLDEGKQQLWVGHDQERILLAMTTQIDVTPHLGRRACKLLYMGGRRFFKEAIGFFANILEWAKSEGCTEVITWTRPAIYKKALKPLGFNFVERTSNGAFLVFMDTGVEWERR